MRIEQLFIPSSIDAPDAADFLAAVEVSRKVRMQTWGSDDLAYAPLEKLLELDDPYERQDSRCTSKELEPIEPGLHDSLIVALTDSVQLRWIKQNCAPDTSGASACAHSTAPPSAATPVRWPRH